MDAIQEETTTLPEGATVSVGKFKYAGEKLRGTFVELRAWRENNIVKMRVDDVSAHNLRAYLDLTIRAIQRERDKLTVKPGMLNRLPKTLPEFVNDMAFHGMFIFNALTTDQPQETKTEENGNERKQRQRKPRKPRAARLGGDKGIQGARGEVPF